MCGDLFGFNLGCYVRRSLICQISQWRRIVKQKTNQS
jgi:hypothetical protein